MRALPLLLLTLLASSPARAHPHIWIDAVASFNFAAGELVAIRHHWKFDEIFSEFVISEYDADSDGTLNAAETAMVEQEAFASLADLGWLTHLRVAGQPVALTSYAEFSVAVEDAIVVYSFALPLPAPVDPTAAPIVLSVYDETYYIDVLLEEAEPVLFTGYPPPACRFHLFEDADNPIYFGMVNPLAVDVSCGTS